MTVAVRNTRRAGDHDHLRLVLKPGGDAGLLSGILAAFAGHPHTRQVDILFSGSTDRAGFLHEGRADVGLLYAPFDDLTGLAVQTLLIEDRVAILPDHHALAGREQIRTAELAGETFPRWRGLSSTETDGPELGDVAELIPMVRIGRVVAVLPRSLVTPVPTGIVCVRVEDAEPSRIVIARLEHDHREAVTALVTAAAQNARG
ncbi:LysR substrate-binding domain-containing protein [Kineosporia mesophila]|nr:LysR substrate-binding domain-containing protein [Kineosporia mesophila]